MFILSASGLKGAPVSTAKNQFQHLPIRIGRNSLNDFVLEFAMISNFHARIEDDNGRVCIRDLGSRNGVFLPSPSGGSPVRIEPNTSVPLDPSDMRFLVSPHLLLKLEIVAQQAPVRNALACGTVLGNISMLSTPGSNTPQPQGPHPAALAPGADFGRQRLPLPGGPGHQPPPMDQGAFDANRGVPSPGSPWPSGPPPFPGAPVGMPAGGVQAYQPPPGQAWPSSSPPTASTQSFQMDLPTLALMGLRELASSLIPERKLETSGDIARFITKLHDAMEVFCRTFIPLRKGYDEFVASLDLRRAASVRSAYAAPSAVALTQARTPEAIAMVLLDPHDRALDGPTAVEGILTDLMIHQVAILDGVMEGVRSLLDELSPQSIEQAIGSGGAAGLLGTKYKARWEEFCRRFENLSEGQQAFSFVFGQDFAEVYRQYWHRKASNADGSLRTERPPG